MQVNLDLFCSGLREAENEKNIDPSGVSPYLMRELYTPYVQGEIVPLDSLDYDAFTLEELDELFGFVNEAENAEMRLEPMQKNLMKCPPVARKFRGFC